jgi:hypothetical protein
VNILINSLIFVHLMAVAMGVGGGIAMSQVGPRLVAASGERRDALWPVADSVTRIALAGLVILLLTGPAILMLKFNGASGLSTWFWAKMGFVAAGVVAVGAAEAAKARFKRGDESAARILAAASPVIALLMAAVVLCAVFTFN